MKPVPVMVTDVPPASGPASGLMAVTVGRPVGELVSGDWWPTCRRRLVTVTSTVPVPAGEVAVIEVAELTVTAVPALAPKSTRVAPAVKSVPVMVTVGAASCRARRPGLMAVTVGSPRR